MLFEEYKKQIGNKINPCRTNTIKFDLLSIELYSLTYRVRICKEEALKERLMLLKMIIWVSESMLFVAERI